MGDIVGCVRISDECVQLCKHCTILTKYGRCWKDDMIPYMKHEFYLIIVPPSSEQETRRD